MKKKFFSMIILGFILGGISSVLLVKKSVRRNPASQNGQGPLIGKHSSLFQIHIYANSELPDAENQDVVLKARILPAQKISSEVYFQWVLPPSVHLVSGEIADSIPGVNIPVSGFELEITVQGLSQHSEPRPVILQVYSEIGDVRIGNAGVFNPDRTDSNPKKFMQKKVQAVKLPKSIQQ